MNWFQSLFQKKSKSRLGIDLGSSAIKLVEISLEEKKMKLETYGLAYFSAEGFKSKFSKDKPFEEIYKSEAEQSSEMIFQQGFSSGSIFDVLTNKEISKIIRDLFTQAKVKANEGYFSLPVFATFSTVIELPDMPREEIAAAIPFEAKKYIPIPLEDVELDWMFVEPSIEKKAVEGEKKQEARENLLDSNQPEKNQIILVAILKEAVEKYLKIAKAANINALALEPESFSLVRALVNNGAAATVLVDVGSSFADIILVEGGAIRFVRNDKKRLENETQQPDKIFLANRIKESINLYQKKTPIAEGKFKCVLTGGGALSPDLAEFLSKELNQEVIIGNPFSRFEYEKILEPALKEVGPSLSVAAGLAMRE